jgi:hypothetical protein
MFDIGKKYELHFEDSDGYHSLPNCVATEVKGVVVKFRQLDREFIVNTTSHAFIKADPQQT